jgi:hypothetical protein
MDETPTLQECMTVMADSDLMSKKPRPGLNGKTECEPRDRAPSSRSVSPLELYLGLTYCMKGWKKKRVNG